MKKKAGKLWIQDIRNGEKLDNAALAFPLVTGKDDTRVFRFYCQLKKKVDGEILQSALDQARKNIRCFRQF